MGWNFRHTLLLSTTLCLAAATVALGQKVRPISSSTHASSGASSGGKTRREPVGLVADKVDYSKDNNIVIARGHVQAWQGDQVLTADTITFYRNIDKAVARGHVTLTEPNGEVMYADYAELSQDMKNGIFAKLSARLPDNAKLVANAGRRVDGKINELSRAVYTACNLCKKDPTRAPEWELRSDDVVQDLQHQKIEYRNATLEMYGIPVAWFPFMANTDPSVKRQSGFLVPDYGYDSTYMGTYIKIPYYWVINGQSDLTITPTLMTEAGAGPDLDLDYRERFNFGGLDLDAFGGRDLGQPEGMVTSDGAFALNDNWRYGFHVNTVTAVTFMRDTNQAIPDYLESSGYVEGFGQGSWAKLTTTAYQSTTTTTSQSTLPYVLPNARYSYFNVTDPLGGRLQVDTGVFNVLRETGTNTARGDIEIDWQRPFTDTSGGQWNLRLYDASAYYSAFSLNDVPTYSNLRQSQTAVSQPYLAVQYRYPLLRTDATGAEMIEPIIQLVATPQGGAWRNQHVPNEDSLDMIFSDSNLFSLNRYTGIDRQDGGSRADVALHGAWYGSSNSADVLVGESFRATNDTGEVLPGSGLGDYRSDVVGHVQFNWSSIGNITYRARLNRDTLTPEMQDIGFNVGKGILNLNGGYLASKTDPYDLYDTSTLPSNYWTPRREIYLSGTAHWKQWLFSMDGRRDIHNDKMDQVDANFTYDDECFTFDVRLYKRYTSILGDDGTTGVMLQITFKTIGTIGSHAF